MHVAMLGPVAPPVGGVSIHMDALQSLLSEHGHRVSRISTARTEAKASEGLYLPTSALDLMRTVLRLNPDVVHIHVGGALSPRVGAMITALAVVSRSAIVVTIHSGGFPASAEVNRAGKRWVTARSLEMTDAIIAVNNDIAATVRAIAPGKRVEIIAPHAKLPADAADGLLPSRISEFLALYSPVLVSVGQLEDEYCIDIQIDVLEKLTAHPNAGLLVLGSGSLQEALKSRSARSLAAERILIAGGVTHETALSAISKSDVLLRTTKFDGDAVSIREALQLGTAVVASNVVSRPHGVLVSDLDVASMLKCVEAALTSEPTANQSVADDELKDILALYLAVMPSR